MKLTEKYLRQIIREELMREAPYGRQDYPGQPKYGGTAEDKLPSREEEWVGRVSRGEMRKGGPRRGRYTEPVERDIEATEEYIKDIELDPESQRPEFFYGAAGSIDDPMYDLGPEGIEEEVWEDEEELDPREMGWQKQALRKKSLTRRRRQ